MARVDLTYAPVLLSLTAAAAYLGRSANSLRELPIPRKRDGGRVYYHRADLDAYASSLPYEGEGDAEAAWDKRIAGA